MSSTDFIAIDEEGYLLSGDLRLTDPEYGSEILSHIQVDEGARCFTRHEGQEITVEAFNAPYVALGCDLGTERSQIQLPYGLTAEFLWDGLSVDDWDRFHGYTTTGVPFVFSRPAQVEFFNQLDGYDDDNVIYKGNTYPIAPFFKVSEDVSTHKMWTDIYQGPDKPGWDLAAPAPILVDMLPRLKLVKSRILVLGCGEGHDAAHFAKDGHFVTAVDFSPEAVARAQKQYGHMSNFKAIQADAFALGSEFDGSFDLIFEHTFFCAIDPTRRSEVVKTWLRLLSPGGFLMGVFFVHPKRAGPPFGGSEWEIRQRLQKKFRFLFWSRLRSSPPERMGKELFVYAQKI